MRRCIERNRTEARAHERLDEALELRGVSAPAVDEQHRRTFAPAPGTLETTNGFAESPDVVFAGDVETLARASKDRSVAEDAVTRGRLKMRGHKKDIVRALEILGIKRT